MAFLLSSCAPTWLLAQVGFRHFLVTGSNTFHSSRSSPKAAVLLRHLVVFHLELVTVAELRRPFLVQAFWLYSDGAWPGQSVSSHGVADGLSAELLEPEEHLCCKVLRPPNQPTSHWPQRFQVSFQTGGEKIMR